MTAGEYTANVDLLWKSDAIADVERKNSPKILEEALVGSPDCENPAL